jgi:hypothetical protein
MEARDDPGDSALTVTEASMTRSPMTRPHRRRGPARVPRAEHLEPRRLLTFLPFSNTFDSAGVTTDAAGHVYVSYVDTDVLAGQTDMIAVYNPIPGSLPIAVWPVQRNYLFAVPGALYTLQAEDRPEFLGLQAGDILHMIPDGQLYAVRPSIGVPFRIADLRTMNIDILDIYDIVSHRSFNFSGTHQPNRATYGDIAVFNGMILVTGWSNTNALNFVLRLEPIGGAWSAKVILTSLATESQGDLGSRQPAGIAINRHGIALTTLPFNVTADAEAPSVPVGFRPDFDRTGVGLPVPIVSLRGQNIQVDSRGMTTDRDGNFLIATGPVGSTLSGFDHAMIVARSDLADFRAVFVSSNQILNTRDVAISPDNRVVYMAYAAFDGGVLYEPNYNPPEPPPRLPGRLELAESAVVVPEAAESLRLTVRRVDGSQGPVSVRFTTADGTARAGEDFEFTAGELDFDPGQTERTIVVPLLPGRDDEEDETFTIRLSAPTGGATLGTPSTVTVTIQDGDGRFLPTTGGDYNFAYGIGSVAADALDIAVNPQGDLFVGGTATAYPDFDPGPADGSLNVSVSTKYAFMARYDRDGNFAWVAPFFATDGTYSATVVGVAADGDGNSFGLVNLSEGGLDLDPGPGTFNVTAEVNDWNLYVVKLDPAGRLLWAARLEGNDDVQGVQIETDRAGNVYVAGEYAGTVDANPGSGSWPVSVPIGSYVWTSFVWSLSPAGALRYWYQPAGESGASSARIAVSPDGHVAFSGSNVLNLDLDWRNGVVTGTEKRFIALLDNRPGQFYTTDLVWGRFFGPHVHAGFSYTDVGDLVFDDRGQLYLTGAVGGVADLDPGPGTFWTDGTRNDTFTYVMKLDGAGNLIWVRVMGGAGLDNESSGRDIAVDPWGEVVTVGSFHGTGDFDPGPNTRLLTAPAGGEAQVFVSRLDAQGQFIEAFQAGGEGRDWANAVAIDDRGAATFVGPYSRPRADFGPYTLRGHGAGSYFFAQLAAPRPTLEAIADVTVEEGGAVSLAVRATPRGPGRSVRYSLGPGAPAGATIDPASGAFRWTAPDGPREAVITVVAADAENAQRSTSRSFTIRVANRAPAVAAGGDAALTAGQALLRDGTLSDPGSDSWTLSVDYGDGSGPRPLTLRPDRSFGLAHTYSAAGQYLVRVVATDDDGGRGEAAFQVVVTSNDPGTGPQSPPVGVQAIRLARKKQAVTAIVIEFNGPLHAGPAGQLANYRLVAAGRDRRFGTRDDVATRLKSARYDAATRTVTLTPRARLVLTKAQRLTILAAGLTDTLGRPIDGDRDGRPGGDAGATLTRQGVSRG